jgi:hypothetical protein
MITRNIYNFYGTEGQQGKTKGQNRDRGLELAWGFSTGEKVERGERKMMMMMSGPTLYENRKG